MNENPAPSPARPKCRRFWLVWSVIATILFVLIGWVAYAISIADSAERNLISGRITLQGIFAYIEAHQRWPDSSENLSQFLKENPASIRLTRLTLPSEEIKQRVTVKYQVELSELAKATPEDFPFVVPNRPLFESAFRSSVEGFLQGLRKKQAEATSVSDQPETSLKTDR